MEITRLVKMANDIARFFEPEPDKELAVKGVTSHMQRFWDPRMRREIVSYALTGRPELSELALQAFLQLTLPEGTA